MKDTNGKIILAMLAGASAGVIAGILMAPDTGEVTRGSLKKSASKLGKDLESRLQASMDQLQTLTAGAGSLLGRVTGGGSGDPAVVNTGSNTTPTSHLDGNPTGGNVDPADDSAAGADTTTSATGGKSGKKGSRKGGTNAGSTDVS